jgi:hypothetical protein
MAPQTLSIRFETWSDSATLNIVSGGAFANLTSQVGRLPQLGWAPSTFEFQRGGTAGPHDAVYLTFDFQSDGSIIRFSVISGLGDPLRVRVGSLLLGGVAGDLADIFIDPAAILAFTERWKPRKPRD